MAKLALTNPGAGEDGTYPTPRNPFPLWQTRHTTSGSEFHALSWNLRKPPQRVLESRNRGGLAPQFVILGRLVAAIRRTNFAEWLEQL